MKTTTNSRNVIVFLYHFNKAQTRSFIFLDRLHQNRKSKFYRTNVIFAFHQDKAFVFYEFKKKVVDAGRLCYFENFLT